MKTITIHCFGIFRNFDDQIILSMQDEAIVADIRTELKHILSKETKILKDTNFINTCRFATESEIFYSPRTVKSTLLFVLWL